MELLLLTADRDVDLMLPALSLLPHGRRPAAPEVAALLDAGPYDAVLVDARHDLSAARSLCRLLGSTGLDVPVVVVLTEGGLVAVAADWARTRSWCTPRALPRSTPGYACSPPAAPRTRSGAAARSCWATW